MKRKKIKTMAILGLFVAAIGIFAYSFSLLYPEVIKKKMVTLALEHAVVKREIPDFNLIKDKKNFILSTENISPNYITNFPGLTFTLMSPEEIQEKANKEGDFLRLRFRDIKVGVFKSTISLDNSWVVSKNSNKGYLSGGGFELTFYNLFGFWFKSPQRTEWIS